MAAKHHPDKGGSSEEFARINTAYSALRAKLEAVGPFDDIFTDIAKELKR